MMIQLAVMTIKELIRIILKYKVIEYEEADDSAGEDDYSTAADDSAQGGMLDKLLIKCKSQKLEEKTSKGPKLRILENLT